MICRGHVPITGVGKHPLYINPDTKPFLKMFLPKGQAASRKNLVNVIRHLHLAFKGMDGEEVIGLAYYLQKWLRFGLQDWTQRARELETKDGVSSLEGWNATRPFNQMEEPAGSHNPFLEQVFSSDADYQDAHGTRLSADVGMMKNPLDISRITLE
jgi:hypothetical protein